jgi:peptidoglycan/xylan/chitin deacetylase (PgdA/CDA1 family)
MSWAQITELREAGWEIGGHTLDHLHLTTLPDSEAIRQVALDLQNLLDHGFEPVSFAFPFGNYTNREKAIAHNYYRNLRNSHDSHMTVGWSRTDFGYYCYTTGITATSTIHRISSAANLGEGVVIIGLHLFTQTPGEYNCPPDSLRKILTYVQERGLRVMTLQDAADAIGAQ